MESIPCKKSCECYLFRSRKRCPPQRPQSCDKQREIKQKCRNTALYHPINENIVCSIEPLFLCVKRRLIIFIENIIKPFLPPAKDWLFCNSLKRHVPYRKARISRCERDRGNSPKHWVVSYCTCVFCHHKTTSDKEQKDYRTNRPATRPLAHCKEH